MLIPDEWFINLFMPRISLKVDIKLSVGLVRGQEEIEDVRL